MQLTLARPREVSKHWRLLSLQQHFIIKLVAWRQFGLCVLCEQGSERISTEQMLSLQTRHHYTQFELLYITHTHTGSCISTTCPDYKCKQIVPEAVWEMLVKPGMCDSSLLDAAALSMSIFRPCPFSSLCFLTPRSSRGSVLLFDVLKATNAFSLRLALFTQ